MRTTNQRREQLLTREELAQLPAVKEMLGQAITDARAATRLSIASAIKRAAKTSEILNGVPPPVAFHVAVNFCGFGWEEVSE